MVVSNIFYFHPYLEKISNLTNMFQMGWNHQPDDFWVFLSTIPLTWFLNTMFWTVFFACHNGSYGAPKNGPKYTQGFTGIWLTPFSVGVKRLTQLKLVGFCWAHFVTRGKFGSHSHCGSLDLGCFSCGCWEALEPMDGRDNEFGGFFTIDFWINLRSK